MSLFHRIMLILCRWFMQIIYITFCKHVNQSICVLPPYICQLLCGADVSDKLPPPSPTFVCPSNSTIPYFVNLCNTILSSHHPHFSHVRPTSSLVLSWLMPIHHCQSNNSFVHLFLDPQTDFSVTPNLWHPLPSSPAWQFYGSSLRPGPVPLPPSIQDIEIICTII